MWCLVGDTATLSRYLINAGFTGTCAVSGVFSFLVTIFLCISDELFPSRNSTSATAVDELRNINKTISSLKTNIFLIVISISF